MVAASGAGACWFAPGVLLIGAVATAVLSVIIETFRFFNGVNAAKVSLHDSRQQRRVDRQVVVDHERASDMIGIDQRTLRTFAATCLVATLAWPAGHAFARQTDSNERATAAFALVRGRAPVASDVSGDSTTAPASLADLVAYQRRVLQGDANAQRIVVRKAAHDAFGIDTAPAGALANSGTYVDLVGQAIKWLVDHPAEYEQVLQRAYRTVLERDAYSVELEYWKRQPVLSFVLVAGCLENWAVRNQPGLMATAGETVISVTSRFLSTVRLSPAVAAEARNVAGLPPTGPSSDATAKGLHVVAPGAATIVSVGGVHFVAVGGEALDRTPPAR